MPHSNALALAVTASLVAHLVLALAIPGLRISLPVTTERLVEVEIAPPQPAPEPIAEPPPAEPIQPAPAPPLSEAAETSLTEALFRSVPQAAHAPAAVPVRLPERPVALPEPDTVPWQPPPPTQREPLPRTALPGTEAPAAPDLARAQDLAGALLRDLAAAPAEEPVRAPASLPHLEIEGPVGAERRVVREPPLPKVEIRNPADVRIRFWVSPRGTVVRVAVEQTADPRLDSAALEYIKGFRFNALPPGEAREQWGTIRVRFRLE